MFGRGSAPSYLPFLLIVLAGLAGHQVSASVASQPIQANNPPAYRSVGPQQSGSTRVQAEVLNITSRFEGPVIYSYVTLLVTQVVAGLDIPRGTQIVLRIVGGEVNGTLLWVSNQPYFFVGENVEITVQQQGNVYLPISPKKSITGSVTQATAAGYVLQWYKPGVGWQTTTSRPGLDWYGPFKWSSGTLDYWINPQGIPSDVSPSSFISYATTSFQTWQDDPNSAITFTYMGTRTDLTPGSKDGVNVVGWGYLGGSTIAVTDSWAQYTPGTYDSLRFTETDMTFDNSKLWSAEPSGVSGRYDVRNIGTHEAGHTFGLGDMYESADSEQTMYGYSGTGETKKRTLEWGDQAGVAALYPQLSVGLIGPPSPINGATVTSSPVMLEAQVTSSGIPIQGASVYIAVDNTPACSGSSDSSGYYSCSYALTQSPHIYPWYSTALKSGYGSGTSPTWGFAYSPTYSTTTTVVSTQTVTSTSYTTRYTTTTTTSYTSTSTSTSTIPTVTTVALVPLTITSTEQSTQFLTSFLTTTATSYTSTTTSTSTIPTTVALLPLTVTSTAQSTQYLTSTLTTTVTSYTSTETSTSTIPTLTTVALVPSTSTSTVQSTQYLTSTLTTTETSYTSTTTSTSTSVVYKTVTQSGASAGVSSSPLVYLGFLSLLAVTVGQRVTATNGWRIPRSRRGRRCSKS